MIISLLWTGVLAWRLFVDAGTFRDRMKQLSVRQKDLEQKLTRNSTSFELLHQERAEQSWLHQQFLDSLTFELRAPLGAIASYLHLLKDEHPDLAAHQYIEAIDHTAAQMARNLRYVLRYHNLTNGRYKEQKTDFFFEECLSEVSIPLRNMAQNKGLIWKMKSDPDIPAVLKGRADSFSTVFHCLVENAIKFTEKGQVSIEVSLADLENGIATLEISIRDTGPGIPDAFLNKAGQPFVQHNKGAGGVGLGLSMVSQLIPQLEAQMDLFSEEGVGTIAVLEMPFAVTKSAYPPAQFEDLIRDKKILVVEDNQIIQKVARRILEKWGAVVEIANHGKEGLHMAEQEMFDLVLMDIRMPVMDGLDATRAIRALPNWSTVPILALTASSLDNEPETLARIGMQGLIQKPFDKQVLQATLGRHLRKQVHPVD